MANAERDIWAKVSVNYFDHPKIDALTDPAQLLHLSLILLAKKQQLNGILSARACKKRGEPALKELLEEGLLHKIDAKSYRLHDYEKHQTDQEISDKRAKFGSRGGHTKNHVNRGRYQESCEHCQADAAEGQSWLKNPGLKLVSGT